MKKIENVAIIMNLDKDNVAIVMQDMQKGLQVIHKDAVINIKDDVKAGHRFAVMDIKEGEFLRQGDYPFAQSKGISCGEMISAANVNNKIPSVDLANYVIPLPIVFQEKYLKRTIMGFKRPNGSVGTRNYYLIVPTSMCVSETALQVALKLDADVDISLKYPGIDGIIAIPNTEGCGCVSNGQIERFMRVLKGYVEHPNVGGCLIMDLGCEQTNYEKVNAYLKNAVKEAHKPIDWITVQEAGGTRNAKNVAAHVVMERLDVLNSSTREPCLLGHLIVGTECGASDSFSGITANPVIGNVVDKVISGGGAAILSEIPEMLGTLGMLLPRFKSIDVAVRFKEIQDWYLDLADRLGLTLNDNLVPKNIEGGLINSYIKSIGAVIKGGTTAIEDILEYAEPLRKKGLSIMQGPGGDLESVTGIVASGANIVCFSTGYGATSGNAICPVIKISSNGDTFKKLPEDIDFNAGRVLTEGCDVGTMGEELLNKVISVASGEKTWSEKWKQRQFQVWTAGKLSL